MCCAENLRENEDVQKALVKSCVITGPDPKYLCTLEYRLMDEATCTCMCMEAEIFLVLDLACMAISQVCAICPVVLEFMLPYFVLQSEENNTHA